MNVSQALELANALFIPEFLLADGIEAVEGMRAQTEEAIHTLKEAWFAEPSGSETFSFDLVRELADRNRQLYDLVELSDDPAAQQLAHRRQNSSGPNLARALTFDDLIAGVGALQRRKTGKLVRMVANNPDNLAVAYVDAPVKGTVLGIDIETTGRHPDRGYIINVGWETMELTADASPQNAEAVWCGLPASWEGRPVPLEEIHHITPDMLAHKKPFREDKELQAKILRVLCSHPYLAHNAAFEDSWFLLQLDGYAEARKAGKIVPIDTRDIARRVDKDAVGLLRESHPFALENWARRRGVLSEDEVEQHLGLDDTDLMLKTLQAEFSLRNMFVESTRAETPPETQAVAKKAEASQEMPANRASSNRTNSKQTAQAPTIDADLRARTIATVARALSPALAIAAQGGADALAEWVCAWVSQAAAELPYDLGDAVHIGEPDNQGFVATLSSSATSVQTQTYQARLSVVDQTALAQALAEFAADLAETAVRGTLPETASLLACFR